MCVCVCLASVIRVLMNAGEEITELRVYLTESFSSRRLRKAPRPSSKPLQFHCQSAPKHRTDPMRILTISPPPRKKGREGLPSNQLQLLKSHYGTPPTNHVSSSTGVTFNSLFVIVGIRSFVRVHHPCSRAIEWQIESSGDAVTRWWRCTWTQV